MVRQGLLCPALLPLQISQWLRLIAKFHIGQAAPLRRDFRSIFGLGSG